MGSNNKTINPDDNLIRTLTYIHIDQAEQALLNGEEVLWRSCGCRKVPCGCEKEVALVEWVLDSILTQSPIKEEIIIQGN